MKTQIQPELYVPTSPEQFIGPARQIGNILKGKAARLEKSNGTAKLLLYGPPGTGKSRLALMFAASLTNHPVQIEITNGRKVTDSLISRWHEAARYLAAFGQWTVKIVDELDLCSAASQDLLLTYLDQMPPQTAFVGTSNLQLDQLSERFHTRMQQFQVSAPDTSAINTFLGRFKLRKQDIHQIAVGCGGNVRAALLDAQSFMDKEAA